MLLSGCCAVRQTPGGLDVRAHQPAARVGRAERLAQLARPDPARRAQLGDLLEEVDLGVEEEAQARREVVDVEAARDRLLDIGQAVLERERELLRRGRARLADVVARDRDRMPARHRARAPLDHVAEQPHRRIDRETPLLLGDVLLQDVGLDRAAEPIRRHAVLLRRHDVEREHDRRRRVDRHRHARPRRDRSRRTASPCHRACRSRRPRARPRPPSAASPSHDPSAIGMSNAVESPVCPCSSR